SQEAVFEATTLPLVRDLLYRQRDGLLFAYGVTNSGKSHTINGTPSNPGLLPRALKSGEEAAAESNTLNVDEYEYGLFLSYTEVYNNRICDLLDVGQIRGGVNNDDHYLEGVTEVRVRTLDDALAVLEAGQRNRAVYATILNTDSSRSHALLTIKLVRLRRGVKLESGKRSQEYSGLYNVNHLTIVDLAGSERADKSHATGIRLHEAGKINQSLLELGSVLQAIRFNQMEADKSRNVLIPFRNSVLTTLFKAPLTAGRASVVMFVTVNPYDSSKAETRKVLEFASVASSV
ncbi:P-loop containing nucleoside triphosphate hydrolase protein, partial [Ramicandelaber brevisporus]